MKTRFSRRRNTLIVSRVTFLSAVVFVVAGILFVTARFFGGVSLAVLQPAVLLGDSLRDRTALLMASWGNASALKSKVERLEEENLALHNENRMLRSSIADTGSVSSAGEGNTIVAGVLSAPPRSPYDTLLVGLPQGTTVREGAFVYGTGGVPIGTVSEVSFGLARVLLFSSYGRETFGWIGEKRIPIRLVGQSLGAFSASLPQGTPVAENDIVYVPGPGALPIGLVSRAETDPSATVITVRIVPYVNLFSLSTVRIAP